jgi:hypothetical protein
MHGTESELAAVLEAFRDPRGDLTQLLVPVRYQLLALGAVDVTWWLPEPDPFKRPWQRVLVSGSDHATEAWLRPAFRQPPELGHLLEISRLAPHAEPNPSIKPVIVSAFPRVVARLLWDSSMGSAPRPNPEAPAIIERAFAELDKATPPYRVLLQHVVVKATNDPALLPFLELLTTDPHLRHVLSGGNVEPFL